MPGGRPSEVQRHLSRDPDAQSQPVPAGLQYNLLQRFRPTELRLRLHRVNQWEPGAAGAGVGQ